MLKIITSQGESIGQRPILQLGDTNHMYGGRRDLRDRHAVRPSQSAGQDHQRRLPTPLFGAVEAIGMTVSKNETISLDPTASAYSRVVGAWIRLDDSPGQRAGRFAGRYRD